MAINEYLKIGVLGGMGPEASVAFYNRIIKLFQQEQGAKHNFEYPEMLIHNMPSPDNVEAGVEDELADYLLNSTRMLEQAGMQLLAIPCNSAHVHIDKVMAAVQGKVMNILEETAKAVHQSGLRKVLLLATKSTLKYEIYQSYLKDLGIETIVPSQAHQEITTQAIMSVCDGSINSTTRRRHGENCRSLSRRTGRSIGLYRNSAYYWPRRSSNPLLRHGGDSCTRHL